MKKWKPVEFSESSSSEGLVLFEELRYDDFKKERQKTKKIKIKDIKIDLDINEVRSKMTKWLRHFKLSNAILSALYNMGFYTPTEIQILCLKALKDDRDMIISAETGSGKTIAYALNLAVRLVDKKIGIVLVPTRELCIQILNVFKSLLQYTDIRPIGIVGGFSVEKQKRLLSSSFNIIIATPGRLYDLINSQDLLKDIDIHIVVFDEADKFLDCANIKDFSKLLKILFKNSKIKKFLCSATIPSKKHEIYKLFRLNNPIVCKVEGKIIPDKLTFQRVNVEPDDKEFTLFHVILSKLVEMDSKILIFMKTISHVKRIYSIFNLFFQSKSGQKYKMDVVASIHSMQQQKQRIKNLERFRDSKKGLMFTTNVAARGIDLPFVDIVILFNPPDSAEMLIHTSGRTARAGRFGTCICLISHDNINKWEGFFKKTGNKLSDVEELELSNGKVLLPLWRQALKTDKIQHKAKKDSRSSLVKMALKADIIPPDE